MQRTAIEDPISPSNYSVNTISTALPDKKSVPPVIIRALLEFKRAAARVNIDTRCLDANIGALIIQASHQLIHLSDERIANLFPISIYDINASEETNHLVNQLIIKHCREINPLITITSSNIDCSQDTTSIFPTITNIVGAIAAKNLSIHLSQLIDTLDNFILKQNAHPNIEESTSYISTLKLSIWRKTIFNDYQSLNNAYPQLLELPINHNPQPFTTATPDNFESTLAKYLSATYDLNFSDANKFFTKAPHLGVADVHNAIYLIVIDLQTIINEFEKASINVPKPKLKRTATKIMDNDALIAMTSKQPAVAITALKPVVINSFLESTTLLNNLLNRLINDLEYVE